ncbi:RloB domain-containing protein [Noviherbaspirillum pedocola]|uniref:RloB domain-containing protein n=1 Tax=Noviherbaspirillum pedocola TaxID=2801341 RepID=UPI002D7FEB65|nr:RloB domain-containing protein [Noviherbaspirillum pedocola]
MSLKAIALIPSFELWLLLHDEEIHTPTHRDEVMLRLKRHIAGYKKGSGCAFAITREHLNHATRRAEALPARFNADCEPEPYTGVVELVKLLTTLRG